MKKQLAIWMITGSLLSLSAATRSRYISAGPLPKPAASTFPDTDSVSRGKYTLLFINRQPGFDSITREGMIRTFFIVYPQEARRFNRHTLRRVTFIIDPTYDGVAATDNGIVRYNPDWMKKHPEDLDVVTHEVMHIVQDYKDQQPGCPGWLTEGIADYARFIYGVNNAKSHWSLPDYKSSQNYTNAYRITARFLVWLEKHGHKQLVDKLDQAARSNTYTPETWVKLTGKTVDQLWKEYGNNPSLD